MADIPQLVAPPQSLLDRPYSGVADRVMSGLGPARPPYVSILGNRFHLVNAAGTKRPVNVVDRALGYCLDVIILDANPHTSRIYYREGFDPNAIDYKPPECWSDNGSAPSVNAREPQHPVCATCPHAAWDKVNALGNRVPDCTMYKKLALLCADDDLGGDTVFLLQVPPNSHRPLRNYVSRVGAVRFGDRQLDVTDVVTRIFFDAGPDGKQLGTLGFQMSGYIDQIEDEGDTVRLVMELRSQTAALEALVGVNDKPITSNVVPLPSRVSAPIPAPAAPVSIAAPAAPVADAPRRGRGRPRKAPAVAQAQAALPLDEPARRQEPEPPAPAPTASSEPPALPPHRNGITQAPPAPAAEVSAQLAALFGRPIGKQS